MSIGLASDPIPIPFPIDTSKKYTSPSSMDPWIHIARAPKKPRAARRFRDVEVKVEEVDTVDLLGASTTTPPMHTVSNELDNLERVFYDTATNRLYKLYEDGTWSTVDIGDTL